MNNLRETKTIKLPLSQKEVEHYTYINAKERRVWLNKMIELEEVKTASLDIEQTIIELLTVNFDNSSDDLFNRLLELRQEDYKFLNDIYIKIILGEDFLTEKKN